MHRSQFQIAFDLDAALRNRFSGFYTFAKNLLCAIEQLEKRPEMILFFQKRYEKDARYILRELGPWAIARPCNIKFRWLQNIWSLLPFPFPESFLGNFDLFHSFHHFMPPYSVKPRLLTVHDLRRYVIPELYKRSKLSRFETAVKRADHFITVSNATKRDLINIFNIRAENIDVVPLACAHRPNKLPEIRRADRKRALLDGAGIDLTDYFIAFSSKDRRKNISRIIKAFESAKPVLGSKIGLIIIGAFPFAMHDRPGNIFTLGTVDDIIPWLECSIGLVFTSLYEGFGLPILEGFAAGIPVITSNCSSMPEVAGDAAIIVDPENVREIAYAIKIVFSKPQIKKGLIEAGFKRLKDFTWEKSAVKTISIYKKLITLQSNPYQ